MRLVLCALCGLLAAGVVTFALDALIPMNGLHRLLLATGVALIVGPEAAGHPTVRRWAGRWRRSWRRMTASAGRRRAPRDVANTSGVAARWMWASYAVLVLWTAVETVTVGSAAFVSPPHPGFLASAAPAPAAIPFASAMAVARLAGEALLSGPAASDSAPTVGVETSREPSHDGSGSATYYVLRGVLLDQLAQRAEDPSF